MPCRPEHLNTSLVSPAGVPLRLALAADGDSIALAVRRHRALDVFSLALGIHVGDALQGRILRQAAVNVAMELVKRLQALDRAQPLHRIRLAAFLRAVAHDGDARSDRLEEHGIVADVQTVVVYLVD